MASLFDTVYNPDVLTCLANLSNDEVFTPPELANQVLDMLPEEIWSDPNIKILDPFCKSGVFLREAAKRFIEGLEDVYPNLQERVNHIMHEQLFGIAITEMTSLLSRRSLYCSKYADGKFSVSHFENPEGNIRFRNLQHTWVRGKCSYCGASEEGYRRDASLESHAYEFIHANHPERIFNMKFDVIVGNPPYQLETGGSGRQAKPIYNLFVQQAKKLNPRFLIMIIPSRWFAGGMGMESFRNEMMSDRRITHMVDFANAKDCFPQNSISGGVCYFLWERDAQGICTFTNVQGGERKTSQRWLNEFNTLVRYNDAVSIIRKVQLHNEISLNGLISPISPFSIPTHIRGKEKPSPEHPIPLLTSKGISYINESKVTRKPDSFETYKVAISQTGAEHACEPDKTGMFRVLTSSIRILPPHSACTHSYLVAGPLESEMECHNLISYLQTKFVRFLILQAVSSIHISRQTFSYVPNQTFSKAWSDEELYEKYSLNDEEIRLIESMVKPLELDRQ